MSYTDAAVLWKKHTRARVDTHVHEKAPEVTLCGVTVQPDAGYKTEPGRRQMTVTLMMQVKMLLLMLRLCSLLAPSLL